jgi:hypothetical protein
MIWTKSSVHYTREATGMSEHHVPDYCPECGVRLFGHNRDDYLKHLKEPRHLTTRIREIMVVDCAGANQCLGDDCADANPRDQDTGSDRDA